MVAGRMRAGPSELARANDFVAGTLVEMRAMEEFPLAPRSDYEALKLRRLPDIVWNIEEMHQESPWAPLAIHEAGRLMSKHEVRGEEIIETIIRDYGGAARPGVMVHGNSVFVAPPGITFDLPPRWIAWQAEFGDNVHTPDGDLSSVINGSGEWDKEYGVVANAVFQKDSLLFHAGGEGWGMLKASSFGDVQMRCYRGRLSFAGAEERIRAKIHNAKVETGTRGTWQSLRAVYQVRYGDYGGMAVVDFYLQNVDGEPVALVFMHAGGGDSEIESILDSFHAYHVTRPAHKPRLTSEVHHASDSALSQFLMLAVANLAVLSVYIRSASMFLKAHSRIDSPVALNAFKMLARRNMYGAMLALPLGCGLGVAMFRFAIRNPAFSQRQLIWVASMALIFALAQKLKALERRSQGLECSDTELSGDYQRVILSWRKKLLPDF